MNGIEINASNLPKPPRVEFVKDENGNFVMKVFKEGEKDGLTIDDFESQKEPHTVCGIARVTTNDDEVHPKRSV